MFPPVSSGWARHGWRRSFAIIVAAACFGSAVPVAWADARTEARKHFEAGMGHIRDGKYDSGIAELERAYEIMPHPSVRFNIARAYADAGELEQAVAAYESYLASDPKDRDEVEQVVAKLKKKLAAQKKPPTDEPPDKPPDTPDKPPDTPDKPPDTPEKKPDERGDIYEEKVVTASRQAQSPLDAPNSLTVITRQDIHLSGVTRIPELLRRVAGMDVMQITGGDSNVSMRGLNARLSNKLLVLIDGRIVKNDILGSTFWESFPIDVDQIEQIEVVRGPGSSLYGADAFAGVVNIIPIAPGKGGTGMRVGFGDHAEAYGSLWTSHRNGDFAYRASAGFTRYPRWTREFTPGRVDARPVDVNPTTGAQNGRIDLRTSYRLGKNKELAFGGGFARSIINIYGIGPFNDYLVEADAADISTAFKSDLITIRSNYALLNAFASQGHAYVGHDMYETYPVQHSFETDVELTHTFKAPEALTHGLVAGVNYRLKNISWSYLIADPPIEHHVGVFAQDALKFLDHFALVASGRLDYVPSIERLVPSARGSFIVRPGKTKKQSIRASVATAFRSPTFLESYLDLPIQLTVSGAELQSASARAEDPDFKLGAENILALELGYLNKLSDSFQFEAQAYYHRISDFIKLAHPRLGTLSDVAAGVGGINPETGRYRVAGGGWTNQCSYDHVFGGELGVHFYGVEGLDMFANYAINHGIHELPEGCNQPGDERTSTHKVNFGTQVRTPFGLNGEVTFHYQTKQTWGEQVATLTGIEYQLFEIPDYHLLNARIGYGFLKGDKAEVSAVLFNALSGVFAPAPQMHPFGNRVGRRFMGFFAYRL